MQRGTQLPVEMILSRFLSRLQTVQRACRVRTLSSRASAVLSALDIPTNTDLPGVYDGLWGGTGDVLESVCPTTGEVLARVTSVSTVLIPFANPAGNTDVQVRRHPKSFTVLWKRPGRRMFTFDTSLLLGEEKSSGRSGEHWEPR